MMKKILVVLGLMSAVLMAKPDWADSYDAALEKAAKEKKLVMVMLSSEGCPACEYMKDIVFENESVVKELAQGFVPVEIDIHNDFVPSGLGYIGTPTFHFLDAAGKKIGRLDGGANVPDFTEQIQTLKQVYLPR